MLGPEGKAVIEGFCINDIHRPSAFKRTLSSVVLLSLVTSCAPVSRSKDLASRSGIMLNDVGDGPFQLEIDWIDLRA